MLQASQFVPFAFKVTMRGFDLKKSVGRLAARLLSSYGDEVDDKIGSHIDIREIFEFAFRDRGILTVTTNWTRFEGTFAPSLNSCREPNLLPIHWAVELLSTVFSIQERRPLALIFEMVCLLDGHTTPAALIDQLGLSGSLNGFFAGSNTFEITGDSTTSLPNLFSVECELTAGWLADYMPPENIGVMMRYRSPDNLYGESAPVDYSRLVIDQFFDAAPLEMIKQLESLFSSGDSR